MSRRPALLLRELRMLLRSRMAVLIALLLALLSTLASLNGWRQMQAQHAMIEQAQALQEQSIELVMQRYGPRGDAGLVAYHSFALAWQAPSSLAFLAVGQRDVAPWLLRVRALGLEAQLYEGEPAQPEHALAGRFDFAFLLVYLAPLFVIALLHDLLSAEREAGRARLLLGLPAGGSRLWWRRAALRFVLLGFALLSAPLAMALHANAPPLAMLGLGLISLLYLGFWASLSLWLGSRKGSSGAHAARLAGIWVLLCLALPSIAQGVLQKAIPGSAGLDLMLAQREAVHSGWDRPKPETFEVFFREHPEWQDTPPVETRFHWKWYYALQHAGDMQVSSLSADYRHNLERREAAARGLGWLLPGVAAQAALHRLAATDLQAHLQFLDEARGLHRAVRLHVYPQVFEERPWTPAASLDAPRFEPSAPPVSLPWGVLAMLLPSTLIVLLVARQGLRRVSA